MATRNSAVQARASAGSPPRRQRRQQRSGVPAQLNKHLIVGIGASAGGLEALEEFFQHMPADSGMAFVVVTHQPSHRTSLLPDLLARTTTMCVLEAEEGMPVEPNMVYVAPPNGPLSLLRAVLHRIEVSGAEDARLPIDTLFRALAADQQERAVGIVLSGTGTDGTLGLKEIKGASGLTMVQDPQSARYDGMPRSALATGLVDYVVPPSVMPERLLAYAQGPYVRTTTPESMPALSEVLDRIFLLLRSRVRHDFSEYKPTTIRRRIVRRMNVHQIVDPQQYLRLLQEQPHELDLLFKELLISVTSFFRDPEAFEQLRQQVLPQLLAGKADTDVVRVWVPGCATGEEAYSLGIVLQESLEQAGKHCKIQIFATDIDTQAIEIARQGVYPEGIAADVSADRLARFFTKEDASYRVDKAIRDMVIFAAHNLLSEPPFTKLDLLSCRNLLIYLEAPLQKRLLPMFHYALHAGGFLILGTSETVSGFDHLFATLDKRWKLFRRQDTAGAAPFLNDYTPRGEAQRFAERQMATRTRQTPTARQEMLIDRLLVARYAPPSVIVNDHGDIIHIHGRTGAYMELAPGQARLNVLAMAREGLRFPLTSALRHATGREDEIVLEHVRVRTNGGTTMVRVVVQRISEPEPLRGLLRVSFEPLAEVVPPPLPRARGRRGAVQDSREADLERELQSARDELQKTREDLEASYEEFQSTNEEMQSTNEELQSTNEELESAKEELQSLNEELQTVNVELQTKVESLSEAHDDMANLLNSTDIATIFLDNNLHVKRFTSQARDVFHLIQSDTGRPLSDIVSALRYDRLVQDAQEVLQTLGAKDQEVQADTHTWYLMRMRPYRTARNVIDGVVLTFIDITALKHAEEAAVMARRLADNIVQAVRGPLVILDVEVRVVSANRSFYQYFHVTPEVTLQQSFYALGGGQWDVPALHQRLTDVVQRDATFEDFEMTCDIPQRGQRIIRLNARQIQQLPVETTLILLAMEDITLQQRTSEP